MIETPNKQAQLIDKATDLRQGLFLLIAAQQATIAFLSDLLIDARYSSEDEAYASYVKRQRNIQLKMSQVEQSLPKIAHLIHFPSANVRTDTLYVEMMRSANREIAAGLKRYGELYLDPELAAVFPTSFIKQVRKVVERAREAMACLS